MALVEVVDGHRNAQRESSDERAHDGDERVERAIRLPVQIRAIDNFRVEVDRHRKQDEHRRHEQGEDSKAKQREQEKRPDDAGAGEAESPAEEEPPEKEDADGPQEDEYDGRRGDEIPPVGVDGD
jgi:hypothetical protein